MIVSAVRTPGGRARKGSLKDTRPDELLSLVIKEVLNRVSLDPGEVEDIVVGCAFPESEQGMNVARISLLRAGIPYTVPGVTVNRFCASGLEAIFLSAIKIMQGFANCIVAGGVESMSRIPMGGFKTSPNPSLMDNYPEVYLSMGLTAERVAERYDISREEQDRFAYESHIKAWDAIQKDRFKDEIVPVKTQVIRRTPKGGEEIQEITLDIDEGVRPDTSIEALRSLKPVFKENGTVTAGNSSQMTDGSAALLLMSSEKAREKGLEPLLIFRSYAVGGVQPDVMGIGPVEAIPKALKAAGLKPDEIGLIELNEAFASQALAVIRLLDIDYSKVNVNGGAIALGHPLGCTGAKLTVTLLYEMGRRGERFGMVTMCIGGGMGACGIFELP